LLGAPSHAPGRDGSTLLEIAAEDLEPAAYVEALRLNPLRPPAPEVVLELDRLTRDRDVGDLPVGFLLQLTTMADRMAGLELYLPTEEEVDELIDLAAPLEVAP